MQQDSTLDNLRHAPGTPTAAWGSLEDVRRAGTGPRKMLLLTGVGFGNDVWREFEQRYAQEFTTYAVTLPGFGGTAPFPMPTTARDYASAAWTGAVVEGVKGLLRRENMDRVVIVAHWAIASQVGVRLAIDEPDRVAALVLIGASPRVDFAGQPPRPPADRRSAFVEAMGSRWFRTVTRATWDDNNFMPYDYAVNPRRGLFLWREAAEPALPVWIRYLLEWYALDQTEELRRLRVPTLVIRPGFDDPDFFVESQNYMRMFAFDAWNDLPPGGGNPQVVTIPGSRLFIWFDQPDRLHRELRTFLSGVSP